jgi:hypothetical protein
MGWEEGSEVPEVVRGCVDGDGWQRGSRMTCRRREVEGTESASVGGFQPVQSKRVESVGDTVDGTTGMDVGLLKGECDGFGWTGGELRG